MENKKIHSELKKVTSELLEILSSLDQEHLNRIPSHGGWTAAQIGEHLLKSYAVVKTLNGTTKPTQRPADKKIKSIKNLFLDFNVKMESPEFIVPSPDPIDKETLLTSLEKRVKQILEVIDTKDLTVTCEDYAIPEYGEFTRLEWVYFCLYHTQRHVHQLNQLVNKNVFVD